MKNIKFKFLFLFLSIFTFITHINKVSAQAYPAHWWQFVPESERQASWEILPHEAKYPEVILSKRNELGLFSNLSPTPFTYRGISYASIEAFWQMMKYPDLNDQLDPRNQWASEYPHTREQVYKMSGFESKEAGDLANAINKKHSFKMVSFEKIFFDYKDFKSGSAEHYRLIREASAEKLKQNPNLVSLLLSTQGLFLKPDHHQGSKVPPSYEYYKIFMELRDELMQSQSQEQ